MGELCLFASLQRPLSFSLLHLFLMAAFSIDVDPVGHWCKILSKPDEDTSFIERSVHLVLSRAGHVACFLPAEASRSLVYLVPAMLDSSSTTVVIAPPSYIHSVQASAFHGIKTHVWEGGRPAGQPAVLLVPVDLALTAEFVKHVTKLIETQALARVIFESSHDVLRLSDTRLAVVRLLPMLPPCVQVALCSAVMPVEAQDDLLLEITSICPGISPFTVVRASGLTSDGITFLGTRVADLKSEAPSHVASIVDLYPQGDNAHHIVIHALSKEHAEELANSIGYDVYHEQMHQQQKVYTLDWWRRTGGVLIVSRGSSAEIDHRDVQLVVHVGLPQTMLDFVCDVYEVGHQVVSHVVWSTPPVQEEGSDARRLSSILGGRGCFKAALTGYVDGSNTLCGLRSRCGSCQLSDSYEEARAESPDTLVIPIQADRLPHRAPVQSLSLPRELSARLLFILTVLNPVCVSCWLHGLFDTNHSPNHSSFSCNLTRLTDGQTPSHQSPECTYRTFMRSIVWIPGSTCYYCYAPFTNRFHADLKSDVRPVCCFQDMVGLGVYAAFAWYRPLVLQRFGTDIESARVEGAGDLETWACWLRVVGADRMTNAVKVFVWLFEYIVGGGRTYLEATSW